MKRARGACSIIIEDMSVERGAEGLSARKGGAAHTRKNDVKPGQVAPDQELFKGGAIHALPAGAAP